MPGKRTDQSLAIHAGTSHGFIRHIFILNSMLWHVHYWLGLFRGQAVIRGQVFQDWLGLFRRDDQSVEADHPLDRFFPALWSSPGPRDAREIAFFILRVAGSTLLNHQGVGYREAFLGGCCVCRRRRTLLAAAATASILSHDQSAA